MLSKLLSLCQSIAKIVTLTTTNYPSVALSYSFYTT